jgi:hypothetical protein
MEVSQSGLQFTATGQGKGYLRQSWLQTATVKLSNCSLKVFIPIIIIIMRQECDSKRSREDFEI